MRLWRLRATHGHFVLAGTLAALAIIGCSEVPTQTLAPSDPGRDVTTLAKPVEGNFGESAVQGSNPLCDPPTAAAKGEDRNWTIANFWLCLTVSVSDGVDAVTQGEIEFHRCFAKDRNAFLPALECDANGGAGRWVRWRKIEVDANGEATAPLFSLPDGLGHRWTYRGQGSGVRNHRSESFDVIRAQ